MNPSGIPTMADFRSYRVTNNAQSEVIRQTKYDYQLYPTAGSTQFIFFQQGIGAGLTTAVGATANGTKSIFDTNMDIGGTLPSGQAYLIESIEVDFQPGSVSTANTYTIANIAAFLAVAAATYTVITYQNDVNSFYSSGLLELNVLSKNYLRETPLKLFPPKAAIDISTGVTSNSATTGISGSAHAAARGRPYYLEPRIELQPAVNFDVTLRWPAAVATPSGFNARVGVRFDGFLMRASQ